MLDLKFGDRTIAVSSERDAYAQLRRGYLKNAATERAEFLTAFPSRFPDADTLFGTFPKYFSEVVSKLTDAALHDIAAHQIYDVDERVFGERFVSMLADEETEFDRLNDKYQSIIQSAADLNLYREERAAYRGQIIGGGFGLEGAAQGMVIAGVANAALGIAHNIANATGSAISKLGDNRKKAELYFDPTTQTGFADLVHDTVFRAHLTVADFINERSDSLAFDLPSAQDQAKAAALLNNVSRGRVPADSQADALFEALNLDPFAKEIWFEWLTRFGDRDGSAESAANTIGIEELPKRKKHIMAELLAAISQDTPEECLQGLDILKRYALFLGTSSDDEQRTLTAKAEQLEVERRSFRGEIHATPEDANAAREEWERAELDRIAAQMSVEKLTIYREGDRLIIAAHALSDAEMERTLNMILNREAAKLRPESFTASMIVLCLAGLATLPFGAILILLAIFLWIRKHERFRDSVRAAHPELFRSTQYR